MSDTVEEKVNKILKRDEEKFLNALEIYYSRFGTKKGITFMGAARLADANSAYLVDYITSNGLGMPCTREEALSYMEQVKVIKESRYSVK